MENTNTRGLERLDERMDVDRGTLLALLRECAVDDTLAAPELAPRYALLEANICIFVTRDARIYDLKRAA